MVDCGKNLLSLQCGGTYIRTYSVIQTPLSVHVLERVNDVANRKFQHVYFVIVSEFYNERICCRLYCKVPPGKPKTDTLQ